MEYNFKMHTVKPKMFDGLKIKKLKNGAFYLSFGTKYYRSKNYEKIDIMTDKTRNAIKIRKGYCYKFNKQISLGKNFIMPEGVYEQKRDDVFKLYE